MKKKLTIWLIAGITLVILFISSCRKEVREKQSDLNSLSSMALSGGSPMLSNNMELLGKQIFFDNISLPNNMACATCHDPDYGFTGPNAGENLKAGIYRGAVKTRFGNRKPPSAAYATFSPVLYFDSEEGIFIGGNFWDGRATGEHLGSPSAEQALGPFLNPVEQNNPSREFVLKQIAKSRYASLWAAVWGEPISFETPQQIDMNYNRVGLSIAAYEGSAEVNEFTSKYDYYLQGMVALTEEEEEGMILFNGKAGCNGCHPSEGEHALFTDFTYDNLGTPKNPDNPFYRMDQVYLLDGEPINPLGAEWIDKGLGGFLESHPDPEWRAMASENMGKQKVPTLRNVARSPGPGNIKSYTHNGYFKSLLDVVHFYNTRDVKAWPPPEVAQNVNHEELGDLGLTEKEEKALVTFMEALSDGYVIKSK